MAKDNKEYISQINDYRDLGGYYDIVFPNMRSLSVATYYKNLQELTDALREFVVNAGFDIVLEIDKKELEAEDVLDLIDEEYSKIISSKFYSGGKFKQNLSNELQQELAKNIDNYLKFTRSLRIKINRKLGIKKLLPHVETTRKHKQSEKTKGASL